MPASVCIKCVWLCSNTLANKGIWVYFVLTLKKRLMLFIILIIIIIIKLSDKKQKRRTKPIGSLKKIHISGYVVRFCPWPKQNGVLLPLFDVMS